MNDTANTNTPDVAFKILTPDQWAQFVADGIFHGAPVDLQDGYIHLSAAHQVQATRDKHFVGQDQLVIAEIDLGLLGDLVRWEISRGGALFPHVYGALPIACVRNIIED